MYDDVTFINNASEPICNAFLYFQLKTCYIDKYQ